MAYHDTQISLRHFSQLAIMLWNKICWNQGVMAFSSKHRDMGRTHHDWIFCIFRNDWIHQNNFWISVHQLFVDYAYFYTVLQKKKASMCPSKIDDWNTHNNASYTTMFCPLHRCISKEQYENHLCNPSSQYGIFTREMRIINTTFIVYSINIFHFYSFWCIATYWKFVRFWYTNVSAQWWQLGHSVQQWVWLESC